MSKVRSWVQSLVRFIAASGARRSLQRGLGGVHVAGLDRAQQALGAGPCIFAATHVSWWDGLIVRELGARLDSNQRILVDAHRMKQFSFFSAFDCLALDRSGLTSARPAIRAVEEHLAGPGTAVWVFPQGRQLPTSIRPLRLQKGALWMAKKTGACLIPVALDYRFLESPKPAAFVDFGSPLAPLTQERLHEALVQGLHRIDERSSVQLPAYPPDLPTRALGWLWNQTAKGERHG